MAPKTEAECSWQALSGFQYGLLLVVRDVGAPRVLPRRTPVRRAQTPAAAVSAPDQPAAILLDALGTLVALEPPAPRLRAELAQRFGLEVSEEEAARAIAAEIAYYRAHLDEGRDEAESARRSAGACAEVLRSALPGERRAR